MSRNRKSGQQSLLVYPEQEKYFRFFGMLVVGLLVPFLFPLEDEPFRLPEHLLRTAVSLVYTFVLWQGNWYIVLQMRRRFPQVQNTPRRVAYQTVCAVVYTLLVCLALSMLVQEFLLKEPATFPPKRFDFGISLILTLLISSVYESVYFFEQWRKTVVEGEKLKRANLQSQYESLKTQVNPHFLFNSLNTLITIIPEDAELAVAFTQKLSNVYRYLLQNKDKEVVPLRKELELTRAYLFLLQARFGENLQVELQLPEEYLETQIPPLTLQMLIENAVKHNVVSTERPLHLNVYVEQDRKLIVKNNLQKKAVREGSSTRIGLENITKRYKYLSAEPVEVITTTHNFIVVLPLLQVAEAEPVV